MQELKGYVTDIIYRNDVNFYTVFEVETEDGTVTCTGSLTEISIGENFAMQGEYRVHPTYGEQFAVDSFRIIAPEGAQQIERYLASGAVKGIGQALARRIVKKFGGDTLKIMEEQPERLSEIKGISLQKAREISAQMESSSSAFPTRSQYGSTRPTGSDSIRFSAKTRTASRRIFRESVLQKPMKLHPAPASVRIPITGCGAGSCMFSLRCSGREAAIIRGNSSTGAHPRFCGFRRRRWTFRSTTSRWTGSFM